MNSVFKSLLSIILFAAISNVLYSQQNVTATISASAKTASMDNGIVSITISSAGQVSSLIYNSKDLVEASKGGKFYFSYNDQNGYHVLSPDAVRIEKQTDDYAEVVYSNTTGDLHVEQAFILLKGVSGIYSYITIKGTPSAVSLGEMRVVYRVSPTLFDYGYVTDKMQGALPSIEDMITASANSIQDATYLMPDGSIYTKYDWANYIEEDSVHGVLSDSEGLWAIAPSNEFMNGGPMKQELTVHTTTTTPLVLQMLQGSHFGAGAPDYSTGDEKIYGPFFIYVNSGGTHEEMIEDAKAQASLQKSLWPYSWLSNPLYPTERTKVKGRINLPFGLSPKNIQVVLAQPGMTIYEQGKEYMFWDQTDSSGQFTIPHVRAGEYTLYGYATEGEITDILTLDNISVSGTITDLNTIDWPVTKYENKLWQIGDNDRRTTGFRISDSLRAYGLFDLPPADLNYQIETSTENDWYYAQTKKGTWTVSFDCDTTYTGNAVLTASIAGAARNPAVEVYINDNKVDTWAFGNDGTIYRSAVLGGRHQLKSISFPASYLIKGENTVKFKMYGVKEKGGLMYDCIKLEAGQILSTLYNAFPESNATWYQYYYPENYWEPGNAPESMIFGLLDQDTLINGLQYNKLFRFYTDPPDPSSAICIGAIREDDNKKVYYRGEHPFSYPVSDTGEILLYDFSVNAGDTIHDGLFTTNEYLVVSKIDTILIGGELRKRILFEDYSSIAWIGGIGNERGLLFYSGELQINGLWGDLTCFYQDGTEIYHNSNYVNCSENMPNHINPAIENSGIRIFPNPSNSGYVDIKSFHPMKSIDLINTSGEVIMSFLNFQGKNHRVHTGKLNPGFYILRMRDLHNEIHNEKLLINSY